MKLYEHYWREFLLEGKYWGQHAAGILCVCRSTKRVLVSQRSMKIREGGTWGTIGGKVEPEDGNFKDAARREFNEETSFRGQMKLVPMFLFNDGDFQYQNFLGIIQEEFQPKSMPEFARETADFDWMTYDELLQLPNKHFGLQALLDDDSSRALIEKYTTDELQESLLDEGLSSVLYHVAPVDAAIKILRDDRFMTSVAVGTSADFEKNRGKSYFLSMARSTNSSYVRTAGLYSVLFKLNGQKLGQKYKGAPVDYWANVKYKHLGPSDRSHGKSEMEDRIIVNKPYISTASKYIEEIHINAAIVDHSYVDIYEDSLTNVGHVLEGAKERNIPAWVCVSERDFLRMNKKKGIRTYEKFMSYVRSVGKEIKPPYDKYSGHKFSKNYDDLPKLVSALKLLDSGSNEEYEKADYDTKHIINWIQRYERDAASHIQIDISNHRKDPDAREMIHTIISTMHKLGAKTIPDFVKKLGEKFAELGWKGSY